MTDQPAMNIAIIGAGISGLAAAYQCARCAEQKQQPVRIRIFERSAMVGGNAHTRVASLGTPYDDQRLPGTEYYRWVDLGVNDINLTAYKKTAAAMKDIGYYREGDNPGRLQPLESTTCYFSLDGNLTFTDDTELRVGVSDPRFAIDQIESGVLPALTDAINTLALKKVYPPDGKYNPGNENLETTCAAFFDELLDDTATIFREYDDVLRRQLDPNWKTGTELNRLKKLIQMLRDYQFYPRISAMYFANDFGPEQMLLAAPFLYYCLQEGIDGSDTKKEPADRRYFVGGSQTWIEYFANHLQNDMGKDNSLLEIEIISNADVEITVQSDKIIVHNAAAQVAQSDEVFDYAVMATQANDAQHAIQFTPENSTQQESRIRKILASVHYTSSVAVAHTFSGVLPPNRNAWRCYNVLIREGVSLKPYCMTYVSNRHQNDAQNPDHQRFGYPQFFVTLNPPLPIPDKFVLQQSDRHDIPQHIADIVPQSTLALAQASNNSRDSERKKCVTTFQHNRLDKSCFCAQRELKNYHQTQPRLLFTGGWTNGAGLHENCFEQSELVAACIFEK